MATNTKARQAKPASTEFEDFLTSAEHKANADIEAGHEAIAVIDDQLPAIRQRVQEAKDEAGETANIRARWRRGEDVPAFDYALSKAEDTKAGDRASGLTRKREALTKSLPANNTILAERIKPLFEALLPTVSVMATNAPLRTWQSDVPSGAVALVVVQEPGHDVDESTGALTGKVTVHYYRLPLYATINVKALEAAAKAARISLEVTNNGAAAGSDDPGGTVCDRLSITVSNVIDGLPSIARVETSALPSREWVTTTLRRNGSHPSPVPVDQERLAFRWKVEVGPRVWVTGQHAEVRSQDVSADRRTVVVTEKINTHNVDPVDFLTDLRDVLDGEVGWAVTPGLGLLEQAEVEQVSEMHAEGTANFQLILTYVSRATDADCVEQRARTAGENEAAEQVRQSREADAEERRQAAKRRLHPGEQAVMA